jgi:hypothetical protein
MLTEPQAACATCCFWKRQGPQIATAVRDPSSPEETGTCHFFPPVLIVVPEEPWPVTLWPRTHETGFCADHTTDESDPDGGTHLPSPSDVVVPLRSAA